MAEELISKIFAPGFAQEKANLESLAPLLREVVDGIVAVNNAAKGAEGVMRQATTIKDLATSQAALVNAQGQLVSSTQSLNKILAEAATAKQTYNGTTNQVIETGRKLIRLNADEAKAQEAVNKATREGEAVRTQAAKTAIELAKADTEAAKAALLKAKADKESEAAVALRTKSLIAQERELERLIAKEQKAAAATAKITVTPSASATSFALDPTTLKYQSDRLRELRQGYDLLTASERENANVGGVVLARIKELDIALKATDASKGVYNRNVGNYKDGFSGLNTSIQQILREAPSAAVSLNTFFLAISNNLPIFFDELQKINKAAAEQKVLLQEQIILAREAATAQALQAGATAEAAAAEAALAEQTIIANAAQAKAPSVLAQIGKSLFSVQSLLTLGVLALTLFGGKIIDWIKGLNAGNEALERQKKMLEERDKAIVDSTKAAEANAGKELANVRVLYDAATNVNLAYDARLAAVNKLQDQYPGYFGNLSKEAILAGNAAQAYKNITTAILARVAVEAREKQLQTLADQQAQLEDLKTANEQAGKAEQDRLNALANRGAFAGQGGRASKILASEKAAAAERTRLRRVELDTELKDNYDQQNTLADVIRKGQEKIAGLLVGDDKEKVKKPIDLTTENVRAQENETKAFYEQLVIRANNEAAAQKRIVDDDKKSLQERLLAYSNYTRARLDAAQLESASEQQVIRQKLETIAKLEGRGGERTKEENNLIRQKKTLELTLANIEAETQGKISDIIGDAAKYNQDQQEKEDAKRIKQAEQTRKNLEAIETNYFGGNNGKTQSRKEFEEARLKKAETYTGKSIEFAQSLASINSSLTQRRLSEIDAEIEAINKRRDAEIDAIDKSGLSATEKEAKIADAKGRAEAKTKDLENDRHKRQQRAAQFEKGVTIAQIIAETALAVIRALGSKPYTPANIGLAFATGAIGLAQLSAAIAAPIPQYFIGSDGKFVTGPAITDERGQEGYQTKSGDFYLGSDKGPTLRYFHEPTKIIPHDEIMALSRAYSFGAPILPQGGTNKIDLSELKDEMRGVKQAIDSKPVAQLNITGLGWQRSMKTVGGITEYIKSFSE